MDASRSLDGEMDAKAETSKKEHIHTKEREDGRCLDLDAADGYGGRKPYAAVFDVKRLLWCQGRPAQADDSKAILDAWKAACNAGDASTVAIPKGTYMVGSMKIEGPCKAPITIEANKARFVAPIDPNQLTRSLTVDQLHRHRQNLSFNTVTNALIHSITSYDSKQYHMDVLGCKNVTFRSIRVSAPDQSLNTDGIHIVRSSGINVTEADIKTGDDCVSVGDGSNGEHRESEVRAGPRHRRRKPRQVQQRRTSGRSNSEELHPDQHCAWSEGGNMACFPFRWYST
ncbi:UNVERIFIED_CONTAM: Polygalacturonase [Sesamum angustifolium]|uniref:Polygalacturonase n=1 Tax=Sesamum angustifolium TaxID=2727405 RepID=A0AAW2LV62_9LAMI